MRMHSNRNEIRMRDINVNVEFCDWTFWPRQNLHESWLGERDFISVTIKKLLQLGKQSGLFSISFRFYLYFPNFFPGLENQIADFRNFSRIPDCVRTLLTFVYVWQTNILTCKKREGYRDVKENTRIERYKYRITRRKILYRSTLQILIIISALHIIYFDLNLFALFFNLVKIIDITVQD